MRTHILTFLFSVLLCAFYFAASAWDFIFNHAQFRRDLEQIND
jgi:type III secretory pathway component EscU